jgi:hypothetical protein
MNPFSPNGPTITFTATTSAPSPVQASNYEASGMAGQYRVINSGSVVVYLGVGSTSANATSNATVISSSGNSIPLLPGTDEILSFGINAYFTGITSSGSAQIFITPGNGD